MEIILRRIMKNIMHFLIRSLVIIIGMLYMGSATAQPSRDAPPTWTPPELVKIIEEGLTQNKEIQSLESYLAKLKEEIPLAGSLADPRIGIGILNLPVDTFRFDKEPMTKKELFIAQKIPWFGKLSLKTQVAVLKANRQEAILTAKRLELARQIATTYFELGFVATSQEINARLTGMVDQILRVAETGYTAGRGLQQDILLAQVELSKLLDEKIILEKKRRTLEDRINELLNRKSFIPVKPPREIIWPDPILNVKELQARALKQNPWIKVRKAEVNQAGLEIELALKDYWPDMDFKVAYGQRDEDKTGRDLDDFISASVVMNIPLWKNSRQDKRLAAARKSYQSAMKSCQNLIESLPHKVDALTAEVSYTQNSYRLMADALIVQAEQWAQSSMAAYKVGKVEFATMISAWMQLLRLELQAEKYLFNIYQKLAELEEVIGGPILQKEKRSPLSPLHQGKSKSPQQ